MLEYPAPPRIYRPRTANRHVLSKACDSGFAYYAMHLLSEAIEGFAVADADEVEDAVESDGREGLEGPVGMGAGNPAWR